MTEMPAGEDQQELRALFEAELLAAGLVVADDDRERLWVMWADHFPQREALRSAVLAPEEDPTFIQKPTAPGGGA
jgi:hypothetical protein